ncbi:hypothetical protein H5410_045819, partial [Solanum commersonii]
MEKYPCLHMVDTMEGKEWEIWKCAFAGKTGETSSHLFLHCTFTAQIWSMFLNFLEVKWTMPEHTADLLSCWIRRGGSKRQKTWWNLIPHCIWWTVWKERNSRNFEDISNSIHKVKWNCIVSLYFWCKEIGLEDSDQLLEFIRILASPQHILNAEEYNVYQFSKKCAFAGSGTAASSL